MKKIIFFLITVIALSSCRFMNPSLMLKTPKGYQYDVMNDSISGLEYKISPNDIVEMRLFSNDGFKLTDVTSAGSTNYITTNQGTLPYPIDIEGYSKLPVLGKILLKGLTIRQAELLLEEKYSLYYIRPFIMMKVVSKRVIVFPGSGGTAKIISLEYNNTTLLEVLALAGGLPYDGKAYQIKLIRRTAEKPLVYHIDLSKIGGLKQGNIILQANDIVYVEPRVRVSQGIVAELGPYLSILSSIILIYTLVSVKR